MTTDATDAELRAMCKRALRYKSVNPESAAIARALLDHLSVPQGDAELAKELREMKDALLKGEICSNWWIKSVLDRAIAALQSGRTAIFRLGDFNLHSGSKSAWKIDCDALTDTDLDALAKMASEILPPFKSVVGIPTRGLRFAKALEKYIRVDAPHGLIADDVLTTGASMETRRDAEQYGVVIFARGLCPQWVVPLFSLAGVQQNDGPGNGVEPPAAASGHAGRTPSLPAGGQEPAEPSQVSTGEKLPRAPITHELKTWQSYFHGLAKDTKHFELRKFDRDFRVGDLLRLRETFYGSGEYTGREVTRRIAYMMAHEDDLGLMRGYTILSLESAAQPDAPTDAKVAEPFLQPWHEIMPNAPADAEIAEIEKRHEDLEVQVLETGGLTEEQGVQCNFDRATLLRKLRARPVVTREQIIEAIWNRVYRWKNDAQLASDTHDAADAILALIGSKG